MRKLLLLLTLCVTIISCGKDTEDCHCDIEGYYQHNGTQYRISDYQERECSRVAQDQNYQVHLLRDGCYTCGTGIRVPLQDVLDAGGVQLNHTNCI